MFMIIMTIISFITGITGILIGNMFGVGILGFIGFLIPGFVVLGIGCRGIFNNQA